ncbi:tetracenomycin polyketide synthesis O-methyltransferase tcmP [Podospora didyma]|uniref:Tetracenomycin polyketide synthesis O-methyltransferase tcmP n=1 Tax=Podospora didyma TaxID=330526 RepID=A0AAE0K273_9PEZI|nr:tetracenomycin polyketide synthesis O-methyltransferase tcmP [Podospora didyma]
MRAEDARKPDSVLHDVTAAETLEQLDHEPPKKPINRAFYWSSLLRARLLDAWTAEFLQAHPNATVLHLGCGLDSHALRLAPFWSGAGGGANAIRRIDVDLLEVVALRKQVVPAPEQGDYSLVESSVTDDAWLDEVPPDRPTLVVIEGLMPYLRPEDGKRLVRRVVERFPSGQIMFNIPGRWFRRLQRFNRPISTTGAVFYNSMDDPKDLTAVHPSLRVETVLRIRETPGRELMPWHLRAWLWLLSWTPGLRTAASYYRFDL